MFKEFLPYLTIFMALAAIISISKEIKEFIKKHSSFVVAITILSSIILIIILPEFLINGFRLKDMLFFYTMTNKDCISVFLGLLIFSIILTQKNKYKDNTKHKDNTS